MNFMLGLRIRPPRSGSKPPLEVPSLTLDFVADSNDADWLTLDCTFTAQVYLARDVDPAGLINIIVWN